MKFFIFALSVCVLFVSHYKVSAAQILVEQVDLEVALCPEGVLSLTELEYPFLSKGEKPPPFNFNKDLVDGLKNYSPARSQALKQFRKLGWPKLKPIQKGQLLPRTQSTALFEREDCKVKTIGHIKIDRAGEIDGLLDVALYAKISPQTQQLLWAESYFYFESMNWAIDENRDWDPTRARLFLTRWMSSNRRPQNQVSFFRLMREIGLNFIEQSGVIVPLSNASSVEWSEKSGFVLKSFGSYNTKYWPTYINLTGDYNSESILYLGWFRLDSNLNVSFYENGSVHCLPLQQSLSSSYRRPQMGAKDEWISHPSTHQNLCVYPGGMVESGYLIVPWGEPRVWMFGKNKMVIDRDPLIGGTDQGTWITFFSSGQVRTIENSRGNIPLQGRMVDVSGPLIFESIDVAGTHTTRLKCATLPLGSRWRNDKNHMVEVTSRAQTFCFNDQDQIEYQCQRPYCEKLR